jgi:hypothetical protein
MSVCCECCVLLGRGLCDGLVTRPEESYRLWRVYQCDRETSAKRGGPGPYIEMSSHRKKKRGKMIMKREFERSILLDVMAITI